MASPLYASTAVLGSSLCVIHTVICLRRLWCQTHAVKDKFRSMRRALVDWVQRGRDRRREEDPQLAHFQSEVGRLLEEQMRLIAEHSRNIMLLIMNIATGVIVVNTVTGLRFSSVASDIAMLWGFAGLLGMVVCPSCFWTGGRVGAFSYLMFWLCVAASPLAIESATLMHQTAWIFAVRITASLMTNNTAAMVIWNGVFCLVASLTTLPREGPRPGRSRIELELPMWIVVTAFHCIVKSTMARAAFREVEATNAKCEMTAVVGLLNTMSDAVVELDHTLKMTKHSNRLASMLFKTGTSLAGCEFQKLVASDEDRQHFYDHVSADAPQTRSLADVFHISLLDSLRNVVKVEVFHVCFAGLTGCRRHLLGVREHSDQERFCGDRLPEPNHSSDQLQGHKPSEQDTSTSQSSQSVGDAGSLVQAEEIGRSGSGHFSFDAESMDIVSASSCFSQFLEQSSPELKNASLMSVFPREYNDQFLSAYGDMVNEFVHQDDPRLSRTFQDVVLIVRSPTRARMYTCCMTITIASVEEMDSLPAICSVALLDVSRARNLEALRGRESRGVDDQRRSASGACGKNPNRLELHSGSPPSGQHRTSL